MYEVTHNNKNDAKYQQPLLSGIDIAYSWYAIHKYTKTSIKKE